MKIRLSLHFHIRCLSLHHVCWLRGDHRVWVVENVENIALCLGLTRPHQVLAPEGFRTHDCLNSCSCPELRFLKGEANQNSADLLLKNFSDPMIVLQPSVGWNGTSNREVHPFTTMVYFLEWPSDTWLPKLEFVSCPKLSLEQYSPPAILKVFPCWTIRDKQHIACLLSFDLTWVETVWKGKDF